MQGTVSGGRGKERESVRLQNFSGLVKPAVLKYIAVRGLSLTEIIGFW